MLFVGLDLHKNYSEFAIMDNDGKIIEHGRMKNNLEDMDRFSKSLPPSTQIAIESSSTWYWSDKVDSTMLATLLRGGFLAESYVPSRDIIELRELVRHRASLVKERTKIKN